MAGRTWIRFVVLVLALTVIGGTCGAEEVKVRAYGINDPDWVLVWSDEFDGPQLDAGKWKYDIGNNNGWGNNELQYYTEGNNIRFENGVLVIEARREEVRDGNRTYQYTSSRIKTQDLFAVRYGKIEARIKVPYGKGLWPAFWMLGENIRYVRWPICGEIDIMEFLGHDRWTVYGSLHGPNFFGSNSISRSFRLDVTRDKPFTEEFYVFGVIWTEDEIAWYVNDRIYQRLRREDLEHMGKIWVFDRPFFIILNLAVGGNWPGYPDFNTPFPARMYVDYVRVYQKPEQIDEEEDDE